MAHTCEPSTEASTDCAACLMNASLPAGFHAVPRSCETSIPALVAAYHAVLVKVRSLTWKARSCGALDVAGRFAAAPFLPFEGPEETEPPANSPALTHLAPVSSYFIKPPLLRDAHQPLGEA